MHEVVRCSWAQSETMAEYHDREWGVPSHDDRHLFEMLILEGAQAGLSWSTILNRREGYRHAYDKFVIRRVAEFDEHRKALLLENEGIIRNRAKIEASVKNARAVLAITAEFGSFNEYLWKFVDGKPILNQWQSSREVPVSTPLSDSLSKDLKARGFGFAGSTICYSFMQAVGMVNDHVVSCFRHRELTF